MMDVKWCKFSNNGICDDKNGVYIKRCSDCNCSYKRENIFYRDFKKYLCLLILLLLTTPVFAGSVIYADRHGYYVDRTNQMPANQRILPPNNVKPVPRQVRPVEPFESAYDVNIRGYRRGPYMTPVIPNYNVHYSQRRVDSYTRADYMDVWCTGNKDYSRGVCETPYYNIYFYRARDWSVAAMGSSWKNMRRGKEKAVFLMVEDIVTDAVAMSDAKRFFLLYNTPVYFATIDNYIPLNWICD